MAKVPVKALPPAMLAQWRTLARRERILVLLAVATALVGALWLGVVRPTVLTLREAPLEIDRLQATLRDARAQAAELARLNAMPPAPPESSDLQSAFVTWLKVHAPAAQTQVRMQDDGVVVDVHALPGPLIVELVRAARRDWGAALRQASLHRGPDGLYAGHLAWGRRGAAGP